jgi:F0F1-type ATP synthase assembly protein I
MPQKHRNDAWSGMGTGWSITATMLGGIAVWGGIGFLLDRLVGTADVFAALGMVLGAVCATYIVYLRYGKGEGNKRGA